jgi:hypothetical protein
MFSFRCRQTINVHFADSFRERGKKQEQLYIKFDGMVIIHFAYFCTSQLVWLEFV